MATLNRTAKAYALAIVGAEHVLRWLPPGTHDWARFVTPAEAAAALSGAGLRPAAPQGISFNPITGKWVLTTDSSVNYMVSAANPD